MTQWVLLYHWVQVVQSLVVKGAMFVYVPPAKMSFTCMYIPQVKAGTIFDNVLITDDEDYAQEFGDETWGQTKDAEKKMKDAVSKGTTSGCVGNTFILALSTLHLAAR